MKLRVGILGAGSWGTTVACLASRNAPTTLWARRAEVSAEINSQHTNRTYLPGFQLPQKLSATASIEEAVGGADVVVIGVPSHGFRAACESLRDFIRPWVPVLSLCKGLEQGSLLRMTQILDETLPGHPNGVLTGPNLAKEIMSGYAAAGVIGMSDGVIARQLQQVFRSGLFRVYTNDDVVGCELGGALKNVIAIAAGMGAGMGVGQNTQAAVITRGLAELSRLGVAMGGKPATFSGLAGMGDLVATCSSPQSRNRHVGEELGKGRKIEEIIAEMNEVAEGVKSSKSVMLLAERYGVEMPIAQEVYRVVHEGSSAASAYRGLIRHAPAGSEQDPG
jgi:glycerol-3-phosphate dehydrogenase (NAD(P)+)